MIGEASDSESQQVRQAILGQYISQLYQGTFEEWSKRNREKIPEIRRMAYATHRWKMRLGVDATDMEAFADLGERLGKGGDEAQAFVAGVSEADITAFVKSPQTERLASAVGHSHYVRSGFPTHAGLVELMRFARFPEHKKELVDHLATLLSSWSANGQYGKLFDGETNISLTGKVAHFELGYIRFESPPFSAIVRSASFPRRGDLRRPRPAAQCVMM